MWSGVKFGKLLILNTILVSIAAPARLRADVTLLLEEPYSYDGGCTGTGHSAVYLSRVCAQTPISLRRCDAGETGVVISRYHHVAGRDWIAVPLISYLYAVKTPDDIPLYANAKLVGFLRREYVRENLPDELAKLGSRSALNQLAGSAYDRTLYGFRIATRPEQDDELIRVLNSSLNQEAYKLLNRNCADFVKQLINFYYPKAIHRSVIADLGVMTPKQAAKTLVHTAKHHPEMQLTTFIIPQVPGLKRSKPVHGVIESVVLAKKYVTPVLLFHPVLVGTVELAYWTGWRFNPGKDALVYDPVSGLDTPMTTAERKAYEKTVVALKQEIGESVPDWQKLVASAEPEVDASGQPFLRISTNNGTAQLGLCRSNAMRLTAPPEFVQGLLLTRLEQELKQGKSSRISLAQIKSDWKLLEAATQERQASLNPEQ